MGVPNLMHHRKLTIIIFISKVMKTSKLILISVVALVWCSGGVVHGFTYEDKEVETEQGKAAMFERWKSHHNLQGSLKPKDQKKHYETFKAKLEHVHQTNKGQKSYKLEMNKFAHMTKQEVVSMHTGLKAPPKFVPVLKESEDPPPFRYANFTDVPPSIDWRHLGAVTPVKNQGGCGSCYAFSAVDAVEGMHFVINKELIELSTKEIVDCCTEGTDGCDGGWMTSTFEYIEKNGGVTTEKNYPYKMQKDPCDVQKEHDIAVQVGGHENVPWGDEEGLMKAVANQPVSISIALNDDFGMYKEGVLTSKCTLDVVHAMLLVGYGTEPDGTKYWLIKNSWGDTWGDKGYIKIARQVEQEGGGGYCGIAIYASYPTPDKVKCPPHDHSTEPKVHGTRRDPSEPKVFTTLEHAPSEPKVFTTLEHAPSEPKVFTKLEHAPSEPKVFTKLEHAPSEPKVFTKLEHAPSEPKVFTKLEHAPSEPKVFTELEHAPSEPKVFTELEHAPSEPKVFTKLEHAPSEPKVFTKLEHAPSEPKVFTKLEHAPSEPKVFTKLEHAPSEPKVFTKLELGGSRRDPPEPKLFKRFEL